MKVLVQTPKIGSMQTTQVLNCYCVIYGNIVGHDLVFCASPGIPKLSTAPLTAV